MNKQVSCMAVYEWLSDVQEKTGRPLIDAKACLLRVIEEQLSWKGSRGCQTFKAAMDVSPVFVGLTKYKVF